MAAYEATEDVRPLLTPADRVLTVMGWAAASVLLILGRWVPGWEASAVTFAIVGSGPTALRLLARRYPLRALDFLAAFWFGPAVAMTHGALRPLVDAVNPGLADARLATMDRELFGVVPAQVLPEWLGPVGVELALICYYTYFLWPVALGLLIYVKRSRRLLDEYLLALAVCFFLNFTLYASVPAIGPRFFLAHEVGALEGLWLTPYLESMMRTAPFLRDCFPSGHTAATLVVLSYAFRHGRHLFWVMLPVAIGLILGTVVGRFHYVIDLMAALPMVAAALSVAAIMFQEPGVDSRTARLAARLRGRGRAEERPRLPQRV